MARLSSMTKSKKKTKRTMEKNVADRQDGKEKQGFDDVDKKTVDDHFCCQSKSVN